MTRARISMGFHRLGLTLAIPVAVASMWFFGSAIYEPDSEWVAGYLGIHFAMLGAIVYAGCWAVGHIAQGFVD